MAAKCHTLVVCLFAFSAFAFNDSNNGAQPLGSLTSQEVDVAFQEALKEALPDLKKVNLIASKPASVQPLPIQTHKHAASGNAGMSEDAPVTNFEKDVTELVIGLSEQGLGATPLGKSVQKIKDILTKEMMPKVKAAHNANQKELNRLAGRVAECKHTQQKSVAKAGKFDKAYKAKSPDHQLCRTSEAGLYIENVQEWKELKEKKKMKDVLCKTYSDVAQKVGEQNNNRRIVAKGSAETVETYVRRVTTTICGSNVAGKGGHGKGGFLDVFLVAKGKCEKATKEYNEQEIKCKKLDKSWHNMRTKCNLIQDQMDGAACKHASEMKDACESYAECYKDSKEAYDTAEKSVRQEETDRQAEWQGLKRMECIIEAFSDGKITADEVKNCKNKKKHDDSYFKIKYPKVAEMDDCVVPDLYPTTASYKAREFTPLPAFAKGNVDRNECIGVREISTDPRKGSPRKCKCTRVTLNGPYSPGAMVKCTNCIDVRRSSESNSCPSGTKLFSPQSREDWDTFLKSADPLRAPNWIVDVTRPQNGCGGCTGHSMNHAVSAQKTWTTQDGSPWWLRSSKYNEPNGDYHANCYLDLWHNPKSADSVTFNDGSCSYHSKSYYCQSVKIDMKPKPGSPGGCSCTKVAIAKGQTYSRDLLKCVNCLTVRRSNDKNSCPYGTKLFAPTSRQDWKGFIASATPLRAPHWIIDVTRPQNGCGGCTRFAMASGVSAQATWRTSDNSAWWLRSTRYNEPNGDYHANCYLDLWHTPANENSVTFNDWNCNYRSKSYYCQTVKAKKKQKTYVPPPWRRPRVSTTPAKGSPKSCKCERMKLKGTYSAGALLKCTKCLQARKLSDKNSCPQGTKLFAPASREDWKTFIRSGLPPLRAPNWIIDVTRPQNGCPGCTGHAMNSANAHHSTWKTSDGAPWWLRSRTFNEPSGDYTANCYLGVWKDPKSEDSVTFYDHDCKVHSTSYYCQPKSE